MADAIVEARPACTTLYAIVFESNLDHLLYSLVTSTKKKIKNPKKN